MPEFSVIIATHNRAKLLTRALESVQQQTFPCQQIIVVSDTDDAETYRVVSKSMRTADLFIQRQGTPGPSESRNLGMKLISGDYFIFLDDDDSFHPDFLQNLVNQIPNSKPDNQLYYTNCEVVNEKLVDGLTQITDVQSVDLSGYDTSRVYVKNFIPNNCVIFPGRLATEITFESQIAYEDWDFILSACAKAPLKYLPIFGPKIHKMTADDWQPRGKSNDDKLLDSYIKIYGRHPPPNPSVALWRKELFASVGLDIDTLVAKVPSP